MADIEDTARKTDAGTKLLNRQPSSDGAVSRRAKSTDSTESPAVAGKSPGEIDEKARATDAGTKLLNRQPPEKAGAGVKKPVAPPAKLTPRTWPGAQGKNIWAFRSGDFVPGGGFEATINFLTGPGMGGRLQDVLDRLQKLGLSGKVAKLAIVAHGDAPGVVQFDSKLTATTLGAFKNQISQLGSFIVPNGKLIFFSCIAGQDWTAAEGTTLLTGISKVLNDRYIIGFEIFGGLATTSGNKAGEVWEEIYPPVAGQSRAVPKNPIFMTEDSKYSRWAFNGNIIRIPYGEQIKRDKQKCANPNCPGHPRADVRCDSFP